MNASLEITKRFYKSAQSRQFDAAIDLIRGKILEILNHGPSFEGNAVKPFSRTNKKNIWRIRANIHPAPYRLIFEWVSNKGTPVMRMLAFLPKKHRLCDPRHSSELDHLPTVLADTEKTRNMLNRILGRKTPPATMPASPGIQEEELATASVQIEETIQIEPDSVILEPVEASDLLDLYATRPLLVAFASLIGLTAEQADQLAECEFTEDAEAVLKDVAPGSTDRFLEFLLDHEAPSDLERLYQIEEGDLSLLRKRSLAEFMLSIDDEQRKAIQMPLLDQPFLVEGTAGTGKTIVCLYRLKRMIENRTNETLFDGSDRPSYLFVSFTNSLVSSSKALFEQLTRDIDLSDVDYRFLTLDSMLDEAAKNLQSKGIAIPVFDQRAYPYSTAFWATIKDPATPENDRELLKEVGLEFFVHEVDEVLVDRQVSNLDKYLEKGKNKELRKGLIVALPEGHRRAIWCAYERLRETIARTGKAPFSLRRKAILDALDEHPDALPRFNVVIADEIQDLGAVQLKLMVRMAKSPAGLLLARDPGQSIYLRRSSIQSIDPSLRFGPKNSVTLRRSYRMTREIHTALLPLRAEMTRVRPNLEKEASPVFSGPKPRLFHADSEEHFPIIIQDIAEQISNYGVDPGQFAILFATNREAEAFRRISKPFATTIRESKKSFNLADPAVHLITAHSAKGLEFPHVYIPYACRLATLPSDQRNRFDLSERADSRLKLLYVAATRASESLTILQEASEDPGQLGLLSRDDWLHFNY